MAILDDLSTGRRCEHRRRARGGRDAARGQRRRRRRGRRGPRGRAARGDLPPRRPDRRPARGRGSRVRRDDQRRRHGHAARGGAPAGVAARRARLHRRRDLRRRRRSCPRRRTPSRARSRPTRRPRPRRRATWASTGGCTGSPPSACGWPTSTARARTREGEAGVIAHLLRPRGRRRRAPPSSATACQTRDFVFVGDVVDAFIAAGDTTPTGYCNISTGRETTVLELARDARPARRASRPSARARCRRSCLDPAAAAELLGWRARTSLARPGLRGARSPAWAARHGPSSRRLRIAMKPGGSAPRAERARARARTRRRRPPCPRAVNGCSRSHSSYWKHCSTSAQSKSGSSAADLVEVVLERDREPARVRRARPGSG